jgi:hypothetical protein
MGQSAARGYFVGGCGDHAGLSTQRRALPLVCRATLARGIGLRRLTGGGCGDRLGAGGEPIFRTGCQDSIRATSAGDRRRPLPHRFATQAAVLRHGAVARVALGPCTGCARVSVPGLANLIGRSAAAGRACGVRRLFPPGAVEADSGRLVSPAQRALRMTVSRGRAGGPGLPLGKPRSRGG